MPIDSSTVRNGERVYLTGDCWDALGLVKPRSEERDKFIEEAIWQALGAFPGIIDCINERKESARKFKERVKELNQALGTGGNE